MYDECMQAECVAAIAIQLLLKLKRHLKIVYNLDDVRCQVRFEYVMCSFVTLLDGL